MLSAINKICKILKVNKKKLIKLKRSKYDKWDSLAHLEIMFVIEKNTKKKISPKKLNKINKGSDIINLVK
tara:strand:+ start:309 stop:518 length:210 start_codon:yes stop_codon:yes gene_type:complete